MDSRSGSGELMREGGHSVWIEWTGGVDSASRSWFR